MDGAMIIGVSMLALGLACLAAGQSQPDRRKELRGMTETELHAELTKCAAVAMVCAQEGNRVGMWRAYRAMRPVLRALVGRRK